jgi:excisionase family DNA binding protein
LNQAKLSTVHQAMTGTEHDDSPLYTPAEAAKILKVRESWLRTKVAARAIPCTFLGKHLRFSDIDIAQIKAKGARKPTHRGAGHHQ